MREPVQPLTAHASNIITRSRPPREPRQNRESKLEFSSSLHRHLNNGCLFTDIVASAAPRNRLTSASTVSCATCTDYWRGAVRGAYFRGRVGGGLQLGSTLLPCDCACHTRA